MPSSVVYRMHYDKDTATLRIIFVSGLIYDYKNVPEEVYHAMKTSGSKGTYLNKHIKGHYEYEKVAETDH
ncbi:KTSC domain-containing protein [Chitinophaga filiformis]|uniref:KTSC domain-containing protein n=1 Tax=Chitinophaga filiformis TaxID=104663 RepID=A0A1G7VFN7_CHIFI|nr:KTSC domain-containing protein [Chitinophaga filiformis]SDG58636.1 KTSC domain-containing protein [Chitinophaga filiformis]